MPQFRVKTPGEPERQAAGPRFVTKKKRATAMAKGVWGQRAVATTPEVESWPLSVVICLNMNRLHSQLHRLYLPGADLAHQQEKVRAMVLELARPADWEPLSKIWRGVQSDLELPAPGIAVSGVDGFQLWFSLEQPVAVDHARAFLHSLCSRYLPDVAHNRLRLTPTVATATTAQALHGPPVPAMQPRTGFWSAFVTADLAPIFADTHGSKAHPATTARQAYLATWSASRSPHSTRPWSASG